jgi:hypothetical protein
MYLCPVIEYFGFQMSGYSTVVVSGYQMALENRFSY